MHFDWLPTWEEIPKHLHEKMDDSHLEQLQVRTHIHSVVLTMQETEWDGEEERGAKENPESSRNRDGSKRYSYLSSKNCMP